VKQIQRALIFLAIVFGMASPDADGSSAGQAGNHLGFFQTNFQRGINDDKPKDEDKAVKKEGDESDALRESGSADGSELLTYLNNQIPSPELNAKIKELIELLASDQFQDRQKAEEELMRIGLAAEQAVREARKHDDPEVAFRASRITSFYNNRYDQNLFSVLKQLEKLTPDNAVETLMGIAPLCEKKFLQRQFHKTLLAVVEPEDQKILKAKAADLNPLVRVAAIKGLGQILEPDEAEDRLATFLQDADSRVQLVATIELINDSRRDKIGHLLTLLDDEDKDIRMDSVITLRRLSGKYFSYNWAAAKDDRAPGVEKWQNWVNKEAPTAELELPIRSRSKSQLAGRTLMATGNTNTVILLDPAGKKIWDYDCKNTWSAELLPNGNFLITSFGKKQVEEVTWDKKVVWSMPTTAIRAKLLESGSLLITDYDGKRAIEVERETKKILWEHPVPGLCWDVQRLENGNTLIAYDGGVIETNPAGKEVWRGPDIKLPASAERLENGNTLISDYYGKQVIEVNAKGKTVWEFKGESEACDARRLENGNTLITELQRTVEVSHAKKIIWKHDDNHGGGSSRK